MRLRWSAEARHDFAEARAYIAAENPRAARDWAVRIRQSVERIRRFPLAAAPLDEAGLRATAVPGTRYRLVYAMKDYEILIVAVWHGGREWPFD